MRKLIIPNILSKEEEENNLIISKEEIIEEDEHLKKLLPTKNIAIKQKQNNRWGDNEIPYIFSPKFSERQKEAIQESLAVIEAKSCFRFVPRENQKDFLFFDMREGCFSFVGKVGGRQLLSLAVGCLNDYIIWHEVMHALGLEHEHQRPDRDRYIEIQWKNVEPGKEKQKFHPKDVSINSKDEINSCNDRSLNCQSLAKKGFCSEFRYQRLIKIQCKQTCGYCTSILLSETNLTQKDENIKEIILNELNEKENPLNNQKQKENNNVDPHYTQWKINIIFS
ncbi:Metalloendopeptidase [Meloidogyne graminicola]|uniref:Metalloendopeptidase n=1 Tax=Meloidogyne graminicola TaxID=189291 RepID=A0A8S9ZLT6_9BILA|nr:Metalloendopeptidase [Meloidogyne graminicola]